MHAFICSALASAYTQSEGQPAVVPVVYTNGLYLCKFVESLPPHSVVFLSTHVRTVLSDP
jgi:hypothetical protein